MQHCSLSTFQVNLSGLQLRSIEIWVLQPTTLQNQPSQVSFIPPHNFLAAIFLLFVMNLFEVKRRKLGRFESLMFAVGLPANSAVVCIVTLCFEHAQQFRISHFTCTWGIIWWLIIVEPVNKALMSYIRLCKYATLNSNEPIKVAHLQKLANQSVLDGALVIEKW